MHSRLKSVPNLGGETVDTQRDEAPSGVDLVPVHVRASAEPQPVDRANRDAATSLGGERRMTNLECVIVYVCVLEVLEQTAREQQLRLGSAQRVTEVRELRAQRCMRAEESDVSSPTPFKKLIA